MNNEFLFLVPRLWFDFSSENFLVTEIERA